MLIGAYEKNYSVTSFRRSMWVGKLLGPDPVVSLVWILWGYQVKQPSLVRPS